MTPSAGPLEELYQSVILDHNRRPRNYREMADATARADGNNPLCGDEVTVWLRVEGDVITDVSFRAVGCAISRASASMMTSAVKGKTRDEAEQLFARFHGVVTGHPADGIGAGRPDRADPVSSLDVFSGVSRFPMRVKCASLSWHALRSALASAGSGAAGS